MKPLTQFSLFDRGSDFRCRCIMFFKSSLNCLWAS